MEMCSAWTDCVGATSGTEFLTVAVDSADFSASIGVSAGSHRVMLCSIFSMLRSTPFGIEKGTSKARTHINSPSNGMLLR